MIQQDDLPRDTAIGEFKTITGNHPLLINAGGAELYAILWFCHIENRTEISGHVTLYQYPSFILAEKFFLHITNEFNGVLLENVGNTALIKKVFPPFPFPKATAIKFIRKQYVVEINGMVNKDQSFSRGNLTPTSLVRYAKLLDQRLITLEGQTDSH